MNYRNLPGASRRTKQCCCFLLQQWRETELTPLKIKYRHARSDSQRYVHAHVYMQFQRLHMCMCKNNFEISQALLRCIKHILYLSKNRTEYFYRIPSFFFSLSCKLINYLYILILYLQINLQYTVFILSVHAFCKVILC